MAGIVQELIERRKRAREARAKDPEPGSILTLPRQLDGSPGGAVFQVVHRDPDATLYWHLDDAYLGQTRFIHQMRLAPEPGKHTVTVVDGDGNPVSVGFTVANTL